MARKPDEINEEDDDVDDSRAVRNVTRPDIIRPIGTRARRHRKLSQSLGRMTRSLTGRSRTRSRV